jgi:biotin carboxyl carrier protein
MTVDGKNYTVEIDDPNASPATVLVNGRPFEVTLSQERTRSRVAPVARKEVNLEQTYVPTVSPTFVETVVETEEARPSTQEAAPAPVGDVHQVSAPMPGKILDIAVQVGSKVKQGDTLCNLEAMKMKSPIRTTVDGTVVQVLIGEGQNVNFGDVLFALQ